MAATTAGEDHLVWTAAGVLGAPMDTIGVGGHGAMCVTEA